ncbi:uracil-DNA glycosylase [Ramlibacter sp. 2FC]|uniref:uracil-DNA glycosylase n=1 Tax=Ramlibacter sp. 2FC TaxID=2502188 RepID=UPI0010F57011|nr:uracil-DNA glycosylase [Ramlibacter sp. 2FC]
MSEATRFELDERQRAMLAEMGVRVWQPAAPAPQQGSAVAAPVEAPLRAPRVAAPVPPAMQALSVEAPVRPAAEPAARAPRPTGVESMDWTELEQAVAACQACGLCASRKNTVFGVGDTQARWMVVGEAPGEKEDLQGEPFVGPAGQLLDNMLKALGLSRQAQGGQGVYIANVLKCRPPANRNPEPAEVAQCEPFLRRQVALVQPRIILAMGRFAVQSLLQTSEPIGRLRGRVHSYQGVPVVVTYHPAYLLRNLPDKAKAWADLCLALELVRQQG